MSQDLSFKFDRELKTNEQEFWSKLFAAFPCDHNRYLQSWITKYKDIKNLVLDYEKIEKTQTYDCLKDNINYDYFLKAKNIYESILPERKKENHFLMCFYSLACQDWDLKINKTCISVATDFTSKDWENSTIAVTLAMCSDLMAGRINDIYPNLGKIKPVSFSGEIKLPSQPFDIIIKVNERFVERYTGNKLDFEYSFARSGDDIKKLSPFEKQNELLSLISYQKLRQQVTEKNISSSKIKI